MPWFCLCDWWTCMIMNQVNECVIIACCCEHTCDRNDELYVYIRKTMGSNVLSKRGKPWCRPCMMNALREIRYRMERRLLYNEEFLL